MSADRVPVSQAIEALRAELEASIVEGQGKGLRFEATSVELELQAEVEWATEARAGVKWWLISGGAGASRTSTATQTVRLTLTPQRVDPDGSTGRVQLSGGDEA